MTGEKASRNTLKDGKAWPTWGRPWALGAHEYPQVSRGGTEYLEQAHMLYTAVLRAAQAARELVPLRVVAHLLNSRLSFPHGTPHPSHFAGLLPNFFSP